MAKKTVLFEGDSWFAYPEDPTGPSNVYLKFQFINTGLPSQSQYRIHFQSNPANLSGGRNRPLSRNSDTIAAMASPQNKELRRVLTIADVWALVISGGGNDIVDALNTGRLLRKYDPNSTPAQCVNQPQLNKLLGSIEKSYQDIISFCKQKSKNKKIHIVAHDYTFFKPSGKASRAGFGLAGLMGIGPWLKPALKAAGYPDKVIDTKGQAVCDYIMKKFSDRLKKLEKQHKIFHLVRTQEIENLSDDLIDELHLDHAGCMEVAEAIMRKLRTLK